MAFPYRLNHLGQKIDELQFRKAMDLYYEISGWDKNGVPTRGKLVDLELDWLIDEAVS